MSNFEIHELTEKAINRNSNIVHDTLENGSYATGKNLAGAVADLASANVAAAYDSTVTYAIGQYCLYEGDIYRCIAITTGAFDSTAWTQIVVTGEFRRVVELTSAQYSALSSAEKNNGTLYVLTDEETTADDIPYAQGVSVKDKIDGLAIDDLDDVSLTNPTNGDVLSYSSTGGSQGTGGWVNKAIYPLFQISAEIKGSTVNIAANSWGDSIVSIPTVSGYRPIAFYKVYPNSPANLCINSFDIEETQGTYTGRIRLRSFSSSAIDANARVSILYIRES